jgi:hypothetical protein
MAIKLKVPERVRNFMTISVIVSFLRRALHSGFVGRMHSSLLRGILGTSTKLAFKKLAQKWRDISEHLCVFA